VTQKLKNTRRVAATLQKMVRAATQRVAEGEVVTAPAKAPASGSDLERDLQTVKAAAEKADGGRGTLSVNGGMKFGGGSITITYCGLPNTPRGRGVAWDNAPHALVMIQGYDADGNRTARGNVDVLRVHPRSAPFRQRKGDLDTVLKVTVRQLPALFDALVAAGGEKTAKTKRKASDLRSPSEKALGLQSGELYGEDEFEPTDMGTLSYKGFKVEFTQNETTSSITGWVKGIGDIVFDHALDSAKSKAKRFLDAYQRNLDAGMSESDAKKKARSASARTASKSVHFTGELIVYREEKEETIQVDFEVPVTGTYADFVKALEQKLNELAGEGPEYSVDLAVDFIYSNDKDPLRLWLEAKEAPKHPATELFYDWVCSNYRWSDARDIEAISKNGGGFAGTPFTWDYYKDVDQLVDQVGYAFETDPELYTTDEEGNETPKSPEDQAEYVWGYISNSNDVLESRENELVSGDYFVIRYA
jgi:hypothetical protein